MMASNLAKFLFVVVGHLAPGALSDAEVAVFALWMTDKIILDIAKHLVHVFFRSSYGIDSISFSAFISL